MVANTKQCEHIVAHLNLRNFDSSAIQFCRRLLLENTTHIQVQTYVVNLLINSFLCGRDELKKKYKLNCNLNAIICWGAN